MAVKSGDVCECRAARYGVYASVDRGGVCTRYLRCPACRKTAKHVVKSCEIRRRSVPS